MKTGRTAHFGQRAIALALLVIMVLPPSARAGQLARAANAVGGVTEQLDLTVGRSAVLRMERPIARVSLSTPEIADAMVTSPYEVLVHGKTPGTISLLVWADNGSIKTYDVMVRRDLTALDAQFKKIFPNENIAVASNGKDVVLSGVVTSKYIVDRASSLALGYVEKPENVQNLIRQVEGQATNQVMLRVRFAEVSRSAMQELGVSIFTGPNGKGDWIGRSTTQQYPAPTFDQDRGLVFSDFLNLFLFNTEEQLGAAIRALKGKGLFQSLAEPNLITQDGKEASFLAGGEYPYPVVQANGNSNAVTIVFKEFGVRLKFTPTITADDMIQLKVAPEVSSLDFANAVVLEGFRVPSLSTRRTETQVELRDGQTFAIAGMLDKNVNETLRRVPGIGDIPILGYLFRSQAYQKNATELVVMITPHIVRRDSPGVTPNIPGFPQPFLPEPERRLPAPPPAFTTPQTDMQQTVPAPASAAKPANTTTMTMPANMPAPKPVVSPAPVTSAPASSVPAAATQTAPVQITPPMTQPVAQTAKPASASPAPAAATQTAPAVTQPVTQTAKPAAASPAPAAATQTAPAQITPPMTQPAAQTAKPASALTTPVKPQIQPEPAAIKNTKSEAEALERARKDAEKRQQEEQKRQAQEDALRVVKERDELARAQKAAEKQQEVDKRAADKRAEDQVAADRQRWLDQQEEAARAKAEIDKVAKQQASRDAEQKKNDARSEEERKIAEKLAREQARRDAEEQRIEAARLAEEKKLEEKHRKAQEKLAKEQAAREDELAKLVAQYKKLTEGK